ncbi:MULTISPECIES: TetR/AcrR family transcriptional regulator [unclassified Duganella]|jgi:AcrR family transcriptional regulator|uniref:TetR/AcrR family transcriptional regulator n=1 Tax=unclassified Duganella TaxID=2636909 RepID=UPI00088AAE8D|nr:MULTISPECIES: TetR/AcrR family transcriptional regulator [unclassified Duganella]SDF74907.1 transcriptional regulator, TetR family [Duganella sp. OV458]SDI54639.1 transcriptional regulator, TetR family [Duganella sp. OV510]
MSILSKFSFKDQAFKLRESAILDATTSVLSSKGYDLMTMDDVAGAVGISKPSLYKHFKSKEELVGEAMIRLLDGAIEQVGAMDASLGPVQKLSDLLEWALRVRLGGGLPFLPSTSPHVRDMLMRNVKYMLRVVKLNRQLEALVKQGQKEGLLNASLPSDVILFSYYARTCDPAVEFLSKYSKMSNDAIVQHMLTVAFKGL